MPTLVACRASVTPPAVGAKLLHVSPGGNDAASGLAPASALRTIAAALAKASAGDVIWLEPGATFNEPLTLSKGGSAGRPLVLSSDPKNRARLVAPAGKSAIAISNTGSIQPGGGGVLGDPQRLATLAAYRLQAGSPALAAGLDPRAFGQDSGGRDYYGAPLPVGVGYDIGAQQRTPPPVVR